MTTWIKDSNGNKCSVEYFGGKEAAQKALDSLKNCRNCINCSRCSYCSDCSGCSDCSDCSRCSDCSDCSDCSGCSRCSDCSDCSGCSDCSDCSDCSRCSYCSDCSDCSRCSYCSDCSGCSDCSDCSRCSDCSGCSDCSRCSDCSGCSRCSDCSDCSGCSGCSYCSDCSGRKNQHDGAGTGAALPPEIPVLENIHTQVYEAAKQENALNMSQWHSDGFCGTTHCRAGWVTHLCGDQGKKLEEYWGGSNHAAWLIYRKSDPSIIGKRPNFFATNEEALADMKAWAEKEAAQ